MKMMMQQQQQGDGSVVFRFDCASASPFPSDRVLFISSSSSSAHSQAHSQAQSALLNVFDRIVLPSSHQYHHHQLLMVDGNRVLHPRGFGLACHIGVLANLPTIGVGKNALRPGPGSLKPVYISIGHRVSLDSAITLVKMCSKFRIPEPTRQADIRSKVFLQKHRGSPNFNKLSRARDDGRSDMSDASETVKEGIINIIDTVEAIGENTKKAAETVWDSTKEGTDTIKEKLKDSGKAPPREDADADAAAMESGIDEEWKRRLH